MATCVKILVSQCLLRILLAVTLHIDSVQIKTNYGEDYLINHIFCCCLNPCSCTGATRHVKDTRTERDGGPSTDATHFFDKVNLYPLKEAEKRFPFHIYVKYLVYLCVIIKDKAL